MTDNPIITITDQHVVNCVLERVLHHKYIMEDKMKEAAKEFFNKYPQFMITQIEMFDVYCDLKCVVNLQLK